MQKDACIFLYVRGAAYLREAKCASLTPFANLKKPIAWFPTHYPLIHKLALATLMLGSTSLLPAQSNGWQPQSYKGEKTYKPVKKRQDGGHHEHILQAYNSPT